MQELLHSYAISKETISDLIFHPMISILLHKCTRHIRFLTLNQLTTENREEKISQLLRLLLPQIGIPLKNRIPQDKCYPTTLLFGLNYRKLKTNHMLYGVSWIRRGRCCCGDTTCDVRRRVDGCWLTGLCEWRIRYRSVLYSSLAE